MVPTQIRDKAMFTIGSRVKMHPATDAFMQGDVYGTISKIGRAYWHVKMDRSGKTRRVPRAPSELSLIIPIEG